MLFFSDNIVKDKTTYCSLISKEIEYISSIKKSLNKQKDFILAYMQKFAETTNPINSISASEVESFLNDLKKYLNIVNEDLSILDDITVKLNSLKEQESAFEFEKYSTTYSDNFKKIFQDLSTIENFLITIFNNYFDFKILDSSESTQNNNNSSFGFFSFDGATNNTSTTVNTSIENSSTKDTLLNSESSNYTDDATKIVDTVQNVSIDDSTKIIDTPLVNNSSEDHHLEEQNPISENTLLVSETKGFVYLPFSNEDISNLQNKYSDLSKNDIIEKFYKKPYKSFSNHPVSRFKEGYLLMRHKENASIRESFDLGMELFFNSSLHPAIISACKNLDELDIYLDYLEEGKTDNFKCFNIVFDVAPIAVKSK